MTKEKTGLYQFKFVILNDAGIQKRQQLTETDISRFEQKYHLVLPEILKSYYLQHNGARIAHIGFKIDDIVYYVYKMTPLLGNGDTVESMMERAVRYGEPEWMIPLADDRANGLYYWDAHNERVYFRYVEYTESPTLISNNLESFFRILNFVYDSQ